MQFTYRPVDSDVVKVWDFEPLRITYAEVEAIEKATGLTHREWIDAVQRGSVSAQRAYLWVMLKRENPTLRLDSVQPIPAEVNVRFTREDFAKLSRDEQQSIYDELSKLEGSLEGDAVEEFAALKEAMADDPTSAPETTPTD